MKEPTVGRVCIPCAETTDTAAGLPDRKHEQRVMPIRDRCHQHRKTVRARIRGKHLLQVRRRLGRAESTELSDAVDQFGRSRRLGETEITDPATTEGDGALGTGLVRPVAQHLSGNEVNADPLCFEAREVVDGVNSANSGIQPVNQRVPHSVLRCGGAHTSLPSLGATLYAGSSTRESQRIHKVLLAEECFFEALLSIIVIIKKTRLF